MNLPWAYADEYGTVLEKKEVQGGYDIVYISTDGCRGKRENIGQTRDTLHVPSSSAFGHEGGCAGWLW